MSKFSQKNVVITGGSTGIGLALAKQFAAIGSNLFLIARRESDLKDAQALLKKDFGAKTVEIFPSDVSDSAAIRGVMQTIGTQHGGIDVLISNAGTLRCGRFVDQSDEDLTYTLQVNYLGSAFAIRAAWPFLEKSGGQIGIVSSVAGYAGLIGYGSYSPSKFALSGLAEVLRMEGADSGIKTTIIYPADTQTPQLEYERAHTLPETIALSQNASIFTPEQIASKLIKGMEKGQFDVYCNFESRLIRILRGIWPAMLFSSVDGIVKKSRKGKA
jgi:3-dehydrosphinganine reductase